MVGAESMEIVVQVPLTRIWAAMKDSNTLLPKVLPEVFANVESVEGDGSAGTIRIINFGSAVPMVKFIKEKVEDLDEANHTVVTSVVDGGLFGVVFSLYKVKISYLQSSDGSSTTINWTVEYESLIENPSLEESKQGALLSFRAIESYLLSNVEEYKTDSENNNLEVELDGVTL